MFGLESVGGPSGAALVIGLVTLEALVLYAGYGILERVFGPRIAKLIRGS